MMPATKTPSEALDDIVQDFGDIFTLIQGFAELAAANRHVHRDPKLARYVDEILKSGLRGSALLRQWINDGNENDDG